MVASASKSTTGAPDAAETGAAATLRAVLPYRLAIFTLALTYWCVDIVSPALPAIQDALALSGTGAGLVFALFFAGRLISNLPAAFLVDRVGPRATAGIGAGALCLGSLLAASATTPLVLLSGRSIQGAGVALLVTAGLLSLIRARPAGGAAMTAFQVAAGTGGIVGLWSGGALTSSVGWRAVFLLVALLAGVILSVTVLSRGANRTRLQASPMATPKTVEATATPGPELPRFGMSGALFANVLCYANYSVFVVALPLYADSRFDVSAGQLAALQVTITIAHLLAAFPAGRLIRLRGATGALAVGFGLTALSLPLALAAPSAVWIGLPLLIYAAGQVTCGSAAGDLVLRLGGQGGKAVGLHRLSSDLGLVLGPAAVGILADAAGVGAPFVALSFLAALASGITLLRRPRPVSAL
ncbi:MAG: MFS transporter [Chloroflexia bacterium]|nr:MFS transporter [Chloroflexia bacterium]